MFNGPKTGRTWLWNQNADWSNCEQKFWTCRYSRLGISYQVFRIGRRKFGIHIERNFRTGVRTLFRWSKIWTVHIGLISPWGIFSDFQKLLNSYSAMVYDNQLDFQKMHSIYMPWYHKYVFWFIIAPPCGQKLIFIKENPWNSCTLKFWEEFLLKLLPKLKVK